MALCDGALSITIKNWFEDRPLVKSNRNLLTSRPATPHSTNYKASIRSELHANSREAEYRDFISKLIALDPQGAQLLPWNEEEFIELSSKKIIFTFILIPLDINDDNFLT